MSTNIITFSSIYVKKSIFSLCKKFEIWRINHFFQILQIKRFLGRFLPTKHFSPYAYYIKALDMVVVVTDDCVSTTTQKSNWGSVIYRNSAKPENIIGFQLCGISRYLHPYEKKCKNSCKVNWLICRIANEIGGQLDEVFGEAFPVVRKIILYYPDMTVHIPR
ncbi:MAG: hypothetical protein AAB488_01600 [Patescibacteria group bacterium]